MSTIAWDGSQLAADRQATVEELICTVTKSTQLSNGVVLAWYGIQHQGLMLVEWYKNGCKKEEWPDFQKEEDWTALIVVDEQGAVEFNRLPIPMVIETKPMAWGSGRAYALGAMATGANAEHAIVVAMGFDAYTGVGVDDYWPSGKANFRE